MQIVTLDKDSKMSAVVTRSYRIEGAGSMAARKRAEAALVEANPHLADLSTVPAGTVVVVPEVAGLARAPAASPADEAVSALATALRRSLDDVTEGAMAAAKRDLEAVAESQKLLKSRELKALAARQAPQVTELLGTLEGELKQQMADGEQLLRSIEQGRAILSKDLSQLEKKVG